ncbi:hydrolase [Aeromicrobium sp. S22]|uniref:ADP-ribosylglycohydrolase family protein n=1 Tax=Aeromicrobium sp. S22 TaxID=2662029 RepID=UPI00129D37E2|nr:ADP-ribosylglycohydrolase family protein [Aeromicrobium sp. S22]MRK01417.1 hydrolase [Aeromicrobium sp. S22]
MLTTHSHDRAAGVLLGQACGDALGVPYEFGPALPESTVPQMTGGGPFGFDPGEYSDDTAMAVCIAEVAATGADLTSDAALDEIAERFLAWGATAKDVGNQTRAVLAATGRREGPRGRAMRAAAAEHAAEHPGRVGNGALMRTSAVALTRLDDRSATAEAARAVASLTHADPLGLESCVLWTEAIRLAVTTGRLDVLAGLDLLDAGSRDQWRTWIEAATDVDPRTFASNGFTVYALQAAWAAITWTPQPALDPQAGTFPAQHFALALMNAVRAGDDTDTVAAIAGGLLGGYWGWSAIPAHWSRRVHGYGGHRARGLVTLALRTADRGTSSDQDWPVGPAMTSWSYRNAPDDLATHPHDDGVMLGTYRSPAHAWDAVVSLCRVGTADFPGVSDRVEIRLIDSDAPDDNPHLDFVLADAAAAIKELRDEGKTVFVHCVAAHQRTPSVAVAYARLLGVPAEEAQADVRRVLPRLRGHGRLWERAALVKAAEHG